MGGQEIQADYAGDMIEILHNKPRKSKKNAHPELTLEQGSENKAVSQLRLFIEHTMGGMKCFNILVPRLHICKPSPGRRHTKAICKPEDLYEDGGEDGGRSKGLANP